MSDRITLQTFTDQTITPTEVDEKIEAAIEGASEAADNKYMPLKSDKYIFISEEEAEKSETEVLPLKSHALMIENGNLVKFMGEDNFIYFSAIPVNGDYAGQDFKGTISLEYNNTGTPEEQETGGMIVTADSRVLAEGDYYLKRSMSSEGYVKTDWTKTDTLVTTDGVQTITKMKNFESGIKSNYIESEASNAILQADDRDQFLTIGSDGFEINLCGIGDRLKYNENPIPTHGDIQRIIRMSWYTREASLISTGKYQFTTSSASEEASPGYGAIGGYIYNIVTSDGYACQGIVYSFPNETKQNVRTMFQIHYSDATDAVANCFDTVNYTNGTITHTLNLENVQATISGVYYTPLYMYEYE